MLGLCKGEGAPGGAWVMALVWWSKHSLDSCGGGWSGGEGRGVCWLFLEIVLTRERNRPNICQDLGREWSILEIPRGTLEESPHSTAESMGVLARSKVPWLRNGHGGYTQDGFFPLGSVPLLFSALKAKLQCCYLFKAVQTCSGPFSYGLTTSIALKNAVVFLEGSGRFCCVHSSCIASAYNRMLRINKST